jgi:23S rRNA pseudouridine1911/1915/1917 synthase
MIAEAVARGAATLNGRRARKGATVRAGDLVTVLELAEAPDVRVAPNPLLPLAVVYEDDAVLAVDKPAGMPVHPLSFREHDTLANAVVARYPGLSRVGGQPLMPAFVQRIDAATSGIVLAAKSDAAHANLRAQFRRQTVRKVYLAWVRGRVAAAGSLESMLVHTRDRRHRMAPLAGRPAAGRRALRAVTQYEPLERRASLTLLRVTIFTGVTHQIRCQLASLGLPIEGDDIYGAPAAGTPPGRLMLHATEIGFLHPSDGRAVTLSCPPPPDFRP